jgi:hypothetical protein
MVERPPVSDKIQKITTSRIAFVGLAAATMMITLSIVGAIQMQQASAAKPLFCYERGPDTICSLTGMKNCRETQSSDASATSKCHPQKLRIP